MKTENMKSDLLRQRILVPSLFLKMMALIIIGFSIYSCATLNSSNYQARIRAVNKLMDQSTLARVALHDPNYEVKIAAFNRLTDQNLINQVAIESTEPKLRVEAINKVADQNILFKIAIEDPNYEVKIEAFNRIWDQNLISRIAIESLEPRLRLEATKKVRDQSILYRIALEDRENIRAVAMDRLLPDRLALLATDFKDINLKLKAVELLTDQSELMKISQDNKVWEVRKLAFRKLDNKSLEILIQEANDPVIVLSAKIRLGRISWNEAFSGKDISLNNVVGAAAIVDNPQPTSYSVVSACHNFIQLGDASRIPELIYLLNTYGDVSLAEDYMNCGESTLEDAGCKWGRAHGYTCTTGNGSHRVSWGSKK
jgi:hypothetical protein